MGEKGGTKSAKKSQGGVTRDTYAKGLRKGKRRAVDEGGEVNVSLPKGRGGTKEQ